MKRKWIATLLVALWAVGLGGNVTPALGEDCEIKFLGFSEMLKSTAELNVYEDGVRYGGWYHVGMLPVEVIPPGEVTGFFAESYCVDFYEDFDVNPYGASCTALPAVSPWLEITYLLSQHPLSPYPDGTEKKTVGAAVQTAIWKILGPLYWGVDITVLKRNADPNSPTATDLVVEERAIEYLDDAQGQRLLSCAGGEVILEVQSVDEATGIMKVLVSAFQDGQPAVGQPITLLASQGTFKDPETLNDTGDTLAAILDDTGTLLVDLELDDQAAPVDVSVEATGQSLILVAPVDETKQPLVYVRSCTYTDTVTYEECEDCDGGVTTLTLVYLGEEPGFVVVRQSKGKKREAADPLFEGTLQPGEEFTIQGTGKDGKMGPEIVLSVDGAFNAKIHTSCSKPIGPGLLVGDFGVVRGVSLDGGVLCPVPDCMDCDGGVSKLVLAYLGEIEGASIVVKVKGKGGKGKGKGKGKTGGLLINEFTVSPKTTFTLQGTGKNGKMGTEISILVNGVLNTKIHTSCSKPIGPGLLSGDFGVVDAFSSNGGRICETPEQDEGTGTCEGGVSKLVLTYLGTGDPVAVAVDGKAKRDQEAPNLFEGIVAPGEDFTVCGQEREGKMGTEINIFINEVFNVNVHTSCSKPIYPGMIIGGFMIKEAYSLKGGEIPPPE